jgi:hypothetical protein
VLNSTRENAAEVTELCDFCEENPAEVTVTGVLIGGLPITYDPPERLCAACCRATRGRAIPYRPTNEALFPPELDGFLHGHAAHAALDPDELLDIIDAPARAAS